jgi:uncharacterized damage-inducible protein DinB
VGQAHGPSRKCDIEGMPLSLSIDEFLAYGNEERAKWEHWFTTHPREALRAPVQREGRFSSVWQLMDHIFLVEKRHTERLTRAAALTEQTGVSEPDVAALFAFGRAARQQFTDAVRSMDPAKTGQPVEFHVRDALYTLSPRKLAFHVCMHEVRHWAQIATALRNGGFPPPGDHDLLYSRGIV